MKRFMTVVVAFVVSAFLCGAAFGADCPSEVVAVTGEPKVMKQDAKSWTPCVTGMELANGDRVKTGANESVDIMYYSDRRNIVMIDGNADVVIVKEEETCALSLLNGEAMALIKNLPKGSTFEVKTPAGISGARGTGWASRTDGERATFNAFEDSIYVKGVDRSGNAMAGELIVNAGFGTTVDRFERPERLERLSGGAMERWDRWKAAVTDRANAPATRAAGDTRQKLDQISREYGQIERLESKKQDILETRDISDIEKRMEEEVSPSKAPYTGG